MIVAESLTMLNNSSRNKVEIFIRSYENGRAYLERTIPDKILPDSYQTTCELCENYKAARRKAKRLIDDAQGEGYTVVYQYDSESLA